MATSLDAPDWERVVTTVQAAGDVPDAPDWERIVVGPSGVPVGPQPSSIVVDYPPDQNFVGWSGSPPEFYSAASIINNGKTDLVFCKAAQSATIHSVSFYGFAAVNSPTAHENYMGIYTPNLTAGITTSLSLAASSASGTLDSLLSGGGVVKCNLSAGYAVTAGNYYYIALLVNLASGSLPQLYRANPNASWGTVPYPYRVEYNTASTTLPNTILISGSTLNISVWWAGMET